MSRKNTTVIVAIPTPAENVVKIFYSLESSYNLWALDKAAKLSHTTRTQILAHSYFLEENWDSTEDHGNEVNNQKGTWNYLRILRIIFLLI